MGGKKGFAGVKWDPAKDISKAWKSSGLGKNIERGFRADFDNLGQLFKGNFNNQWNSVIQGSATQTIFGNKTKSAANVIGAGGDTAVERVKTEADQKAADEEASTRASLFNDALTANDLDAKTRRELEAMYAQGANSMQLASTLGDAKSGKGIYGVRRINENRKKLVSSAPGRSQLTKLGRGTSII